MNTHYVYRCYDAADRLLYIGCTQDVDARMAVHRSSWDNPASRVVARGTTICEVAEYPNFETASAAEREAIYNEAPLANLHHQADRRTLAERDARIADYMAETRPRLTDEQRTQFAAVMGSFTGGDASP